MDQTYRNPNFVLVILGVVASQLAVSLYLPSLPAILDEWQLTVGETQLTLSLFFLTFGLSQLFYGALSDHVGRKPLLLLSITILTCGSILAVYANSFELLLFARLLQGLGGGGLSVLGRAILRDLFQGQALRKAINMLAIAASFTPVIAPTLGGYMQDSFDWRSNFIILTLYSGVLLLIIFFKMAETNKDVSSENRHHTKEQKSSLTFTNILADYQLVLKNNTFICYASATLIGYLAMILCLENTPFLLTTKFGFNAKEVGYLMLAQPSFFLLGNLIQNKLPASVTNNQLIQVGMIILALVGVSFLLQNGLHITSLTAILITLAFNGLAVSLIFVNAMAGSLSLFSHQSGAAAALSGMFQMVGTALITATMAQLHWSSLLSLGWIYLSLFAALYLLVRRLSYLQQIRLTQDPVSNIATQ
ncbi:multidrug effflux MFS transporter [Shewanella surugensis]|uniref:Multidrug effflux MFS transporter n=1 Tax=Shewanella surugensis TaxID=212020 RepID=A0ABT0LAS1_9GAMM|nr:multidrug effflux MFS transporter [Shewanella surugensis]MCL1124465.1 multidrug effflux MFS transporter [Shewanella surugensis]